MTLPAGPPILRRAPAAFARAGPAEAETLDRPAEALEAAEEAASPALVAASEVEEACLTAVLRVRNCDCRRTARVTAGILNVVEEMSGKEEGSKGHPKQLLIRGQYDLMIWRIAQRRTR